MSNSSQTPWPRRAAWAGSIEELPYGWEAASEASEAHSMFLGRTWVRTFLEWFPDAHDARPALAYLQSSTSSPQFCMLPLVEHSRGLRSLSNYYTAQFGMIGNAGETDMQDCARAFVAAIDERRPRVSQLRLQPMLRSTAEYGAIHRALRESGWWIEQFFCAGNWSHRVSGSSFEEYMSERPGRLRNTAARKGRKLVRDGGTVVVYADPAEIEQHMHEYEEVYERSWKRREPYTDFIRAIVSRFAQLNSVRLGLVHVDGKPIAAQIWLVRHGIAAIFKLAYDENYPDLSAGTVLSAELFRYVIEQDRVHSIDYLTGDDPYKRDWMTSRDEYWGLDCHNPRTIEGVGRGVVMRGKHAARVLLRRNAVAN